MPHRIAFVATIIFGMLALSGALQAQQTNNYEFRVVPAPGPVTVDGRLDDWDLSGETWCYADVSLRDRYSVRVYGMWTPEALYLAAHWKDPTPMVSNIDPDFEPDRGWVSDSWQIRLLTDQVLHVTSWYYTPRQEPVIHLAYADYANQQTASVTLLRRTEAWKLSHGAEMAYRKDDDGQGCVQEIKLPWELLYSKVPEVRAGLSWTMGWEFLWGDASGKQWPMHRYADLVNPGHEQREFFWSNKGAWGKATLLAQGHLAPAPVAAASAPHLEGPIPIRLTVPAKAARFTIAIDDASGQRVRNLIADVDPKQYATGAEGGAERTVEVRWDGADDAGHLLAPGQYTVRALWHEGLHARYMMSYYNPGKPPWDNAAGTGNWGADHTNPWAVCAAGGREFIGWPLAEGGWSIIALNAAGDKLWSFKRGWGGATCLAADDKYLYVGLQEGQIYRLRADNGSFAPFTLPDGASRTDLYIHRDGVAESILPNMVGKLTSLAVHGGSLVATLPDMDRIVLLDAQTGAKTGEATVRRPESAAFAPDGRLLAISQRAVVEVGPSGGPAREVIARQPMWRPAAIATDAAGSIYVADTGPDMQVKVFSPQGQLMRRLGLTGGRPAMGAFEPQGMRYMSSVAVDARGRTWVVECDDRPRRVSVWGTDGRLVRDYNGNTNYSATGSFLDPRDPSRAFFNWLEFRLDYPSQRWNVVRTMWRPQGKQSYFDIGGTGGELIPSRASGKPHEYITSALDQREYMAIGVTLFMPVGDHWQPVAAVGGIYHRNQYVGGDKAPGTPFESHQGQSFVWVDRNGDGRQQDDEFQFTDKFGQLSCGWTPQVGADLTVYLTGASGTVRFRPASWLASGAPVYDLAQAEIVEPGDDGNVFPLADGSFLNLSFRNYPEATRGLVRYSAAGQPMWRYPNPYPGVHGSHNATMPKPGLVIGPLRITGTADLPAPVGSVVGLQGNLGQEYFLTAEDGLYIGAMFSDYRMAPAPMPAEAKAGASVDGVTLGSECFGGWLGRGPDGKVRLLCGGQDARIYEITGLDTVRRLPPQKLELTAAQVRAAEDLLATRPVGGAAPPQVHVARAAKPPTVDGDLADWPVIPGATILSGEQTVGTVALMYDDRNLYLAYRVNGGATLRNAGRDVKTLFKTGGSVDLQLAANPQADPNRGGPVAGDLRLLFSLYEGKPVAVLYRPVVPGTPAALQTRFTSPVQSVAMDRVELLAAAQVAVGTIPGGYTVEAAVPLEALGLAPKPGLALRGDVGVILSDDTGTVDQRRCYWANPHTVIISDIPSEAELTPRYWGGLVFD